jgi:tetratricopeptide (TPR) repeat protein
MMPPADKAATLRMRLLCAKAAALRKTEPDEARRLLLQAADLVDVSLTNPALLVDFGNALLEIRSDGQRRKMLRDALRWNPRALQKDRILAALGNVELNRGNDKAALDWFTRFEKEISARRCFGPTMISKARILQKRGRFKEALETLELVLKQENTPGERKAEALCLMGDLHMAGKNPKLAIPYYQRVYVMHGRWKSWVSIAYARSRRGV